MYLRLSVLGLGISADVVIRVHVLALIKGKIDIVRVTRKHYLMLREAIRVKRIERAISDFVFQLTVMIPVCDAASEVVHKVTHRHTGGAANRLKSIVMQRRNPAALGKGFVRKMN
ncbi:hypothetical protein ASD58_29080 [Duganella sp. Root1480D1]|nr:hypothetical protein ASD58_29080 [Duganella sp. Root1480D1]